MSRRRRDGQMQRGAHGVALTAAGAGVRVCAGASLGQLAFALARLVERADHVERAFLPLVAFAGEDRLAAGDACRRSATERPGTPVNASVTANGCVRKRCRPARAPDDAPVLRAQFLDAEQRDHVLQLAVMLDGRAALRWRSAACSSPTTSGSSRIDDDAIGSIAGYMPFGGHRARQHDHAVDVRGDRRHGGIGEVVGRHVDRLDRGHRDARRPRRCAPAARRPRWRASADSRRATAGGRAGRIPRRLPARSERRCPSAAGRSGDARRGNIRRWSARSAARASARRAARSSGRRPARCAPARRNCACRAASRDLRASARRRRRTPRCPGSARPSHGSVP